MWEDKYEQAEEKGSCLDVIGPALAADAMKEVEEPTIGFLTKQYAPNLPWSLQFRRGKFCVVDKDGGLVAQCSKGIDAAMIVHSCNRYLAANEPSPEATDPVSADPIPS